MPAIETQIWLALRARLENLVLTPALTVAWPNEAFTQPQVSGQPAPYLEVRHMPNKPDRLMISNTGKRRFKGILQASVMTKLVENNAVSAEIAGKVAAHFPVDFIAVYGDARVRVTEPPSVAQGMRDDKSARWQTPVTVYYECFA